MDFNCRNHPITVTHLVDFRFADGSSSLVQAVPVGLAPRSDSLAFFFKKISAVRLWSHCSLQSNRRTRTSSKERRQMELGGWLRSFERGGSSRFSDPHCSRLMPQETCTECANPAIHKVTFHVFWLERFRHANVIFHPAVPGRVSCGGMSSRPLLLLLKSKPNLIAAQTWHRRWTPCRIPIRSLTSQSARCQTTCFCALRERYRWRPGLVSGGQCS